MSSEASEAACVSSELIPASAAASSDPAAAADCAGSGDFPASASFFRRCAGLKSSSSVSMCRHEDRQSFHKYTCIYFLPVECCRKGLPRHASCTFPNHCIKKAASIRMPLSGSQCRRRDLNPHCCCYTAPEACASANSATSANADEDRQRCISYNESDM